MKPVMTRLVDRIPSMSQAELLRTRERWDAAPGLDAPDIRKAIADTIAERKAADALLPVGFRQWEGVA